MPRSYALTGKPAPPLSLPDANGQTYTLNPEKVGRPVVLFFYPKSGAWPLSTGCGLGALTTCCVQGHTGAPRKHANSATLSSVRAHCASGTWDRAYSFITERESFKTTQAQVIGISSDPVEKQKEFVDKHKLTVRRLPT